MINPIKLISELIGRTNTVYRRIITPQNAPHRDIVQADYVFWDRAIRGCARNMEISGLLIKPIINKIASWTMGKPIQVKAESPQTTEELNKWMYQNHPSVLNAYRQSLNLGDSYIVVNADLTATVIPPNVIERIVNPEDYTELIGYRIIERHPHPTVRGQWQVIEDIYTAEQRTRYTFEQGVQQGDAEVFPNLIGKIPIIHIANNKSSDEYYGNPELEGTVELLHQYNEVMLAAIAGNIRQGRPTPAIDFKDEEALDKWWQEYATAVIRELPDGTTESYNTVQWSSDELIATVGRMYYAQPGSFTGDTKTLLTLLYFMLIEHAEIPEFVMGTAITGSKASAETQMPIFERFIWGKRTEARGWLLELLDIVQSYMVVLRMIPQIENVVILWDALTDGDGKLTQETIEWALEQGLIDQATALTLAPLEIENVEETIKKANDELKQREIERKAEDFRVLFQRAQEQERIRQTESTRVTANGN